MEELQETLKEDYQRARNSWERKDYVEFLRNLRPAVENLCRIIIMDLKGPILYDEITHGEYPIEGIYINRGQEVRNKMLAKIIPNLVKEEKNLDGDKFLRLRRICSRLEDAFDILSETGSHAGPTQLNKELRAYDNMQLLPTCVETLGICNILSKNVLVWLQSTITPLKINQAEDAELKRKYQEELERLKKDLEEATQKYARLSIEAQQQINSKNEIINTQTAARNAAEEQALKAQREAFEAMKREEEGKTAYSEEKKQLLEKIEDLQRQLDALSTPVQLEVKPVVETKAWDVDDDQMDGDQQDLIEENLTESMLVAGCAGSGKSIIALKKARQVLDAGYSVYLIAYTKSLRSFMDEGRKDKLLRPHCCYYHQWKYDRKMPAADYIIVDEIQDFTKEEILEFMHAARKCFFFFGDTAQSIFHFEDRPTLPIQREKGYLGETIEDITGLTAWQLYNNYRLPKGVAKITQQYIGVKVPPYKDRVYKSKEETIPHFLGFPNEGAQLEAIKRLITSDRFHNIGIFLPTNEMVFELYNELTKDGYYVECKYSFGTESFITLDFKTNHPKIMTYHSAKGLQFETVILPYCQPIPIEDESARKALYVAMTRTYKELYMMYIGDMPSPLNKVDKALYSTSE